MKTNLITVEDVRAALKTVSPGYAATVVRNVLRALVARTGRRLAVVCSLCKKSYNKRECRCPSLGEAVGSGWRYFVDMRIDKVLLEQIRCWVIDPAGLETIKAADIDTEHAEFRKLVMRVIEHLLKRDPS